MASCAARRLRALFLMRHPARQEAAMRKTWAWRAVASVAIAAAGSAWAADSGAGSPQAEGTGQPIAKMQGDEGGNAATRNGAPVQGSGNGSQASESSKETASPGLRLDEHVDRLPAKRGSPKGGASDSGTANENGGAQDKDSTQHNGESATENGSSGTTAPQDPANPPTTLFPAKPKPSADPGKPGNPVTPTGMRFS